jgi:DNA repair protein RadC
MEWSETTAVTEDGAHTRWLEEARGRLFRLGAQALTDTELVGLVGGLHREADATELARGGLRSLVLEPAENLVEHPLIGPLVAGRLLACAELGTRLSRKDDPRPRLATPQAIYEYARHHLLARRREEFHVLALNTRNVLMHHVRVAEGSIDQCSVDPREVLGPAVAVRATGLVLVHNHPSGDPEPSVVDVALTRQLREAARLVCVKVLDHLVIAPGGYVSLLARGLLGPDDGRMWKLQAP